MNAQAPIKLRLTYLLIGLIGIICSIVLLLPLTLAYTPSGHITLLTVAETGNDSVSGGTADLYLEIRPGTGRIFIDSYPLSKIDTQITTRFAAEIACDFLDKDCSRYDFFYRINAQSGLVGGPSAGAAATVLTIALLDEQKLRDTQVVMTGTINSGNLIGPVAGIIPKTAAAYTAGFTTVLIPRWDLDNETLQNLSTIPIMVIPVSRLEDALYYFTGKNYTQETSLNLTDETYTAYMRAITKQICMQYGTSRNGILVLPNLSQYELVYSSTSPYKKMSVTHTLSNETIVVNDSSSNARIRNVTFDQFELARIAIGQEKYYSAASFCFGGNVRITQALHHNLTLRERKLWYMEIFLNMTRFEKEFTARATHFTRISELETTIIVRERLRDTRATLTQTDFENISIADLAYAQERLNTARAWATFFDMPGQSFTLDNQSLQAVCHKKLGEAEERVNYLLLLFPEFSRDDLADAYALERKGDYASCIFAASLVKADANTILSALFVSKDDLYELLDEKLFAANQVIARQSREDIFPVMGYSYYEYAQSLYDSDPYSALKYAEYSLEISNLKMYFPQEREFVFPINWMAIGYISIGIIIGLIIAVVVFILVKPFSLTVKKHKRK